MSDLTVVTNHQWRHFLYRSDVPASVLAGDLDYTTPDDFDGYFRYRGAWYHISDFTRLDGADPPLAGWQGVHSHGFFSGVVIRVSDDGESYQAGTYCE